MSISANELRGAMSLYPTGVAVITTEPPGHPAFGMTVNSFTSLSLQPPLIMWNLQKSSDTFRIWQDSEVFVANLLKADQQDISTQYARKGQHDLAVEAMIRGSTGCPMLSDCLVSLECMVHARYEEGDHVIIIGEVVSISSSFENDSPLVFHKGGYTSVNKS